jgi:hypothetical protein
VPENKKKKKRPSDDAFVHPSVPHQKIEPLKSTAQNGMAAPNTTKATWSPEAVKTT